MSGPTAPTSIGARIDPRPTARCGPCRESRWPRRPYPCLSGVVARRSVQVGERLAGGFQFGLERGDLGGLLGTRLFDDPIDRVGQVFVEFLGCAGYRGGRDREVAREVGGALLELGMPFAVGGTGHGESQLESLGFLARGLLGGSLFGLLLGRRDSNRRRFDGSKQDVGSVGVGGRRLCWQSVYSHRAAISFEHRPRERACAEITIRTYVRHRCQLAAREREND